MSKTVQNSKIIEEIRKLREMEKEKIKAPKEALQIKELSLEETKQSIEDIALHLLSLLDFSERPRLSVPIRSAQNTIVDQETGHIFLGHKAVTRSLSPASVRQLAVLIRVAEGIHELLSLGRHSTKRELFYTDVNLFRDQTISDRAIEDLAVALRTIRNATNIVASAKGKIIGRIRFKESGDLIDCTKMGTGGKAITPFQDQIEDIDTDADFILLVEKDAAFMSLSEAKIYERYPSILMTGIGQPDIATRMMLRKIVEETGIPVFAVMDADPYGLEILRSYTFGSKALGYETPWLVTENIYWLGLRPEDMQNYKIPKEVYIPLTEADKKKGKELLEEIWLQNKPKWAEELRSMLKSGVKAEIQALASKGFQYMTEEYLPQKLESADWI
ncbi:MAG: hypothetical protein ACFFCD_02425 [Promethearchaeota archaeon]